VLAFQDGDSGVELARRLPMQEGVAEAAVEVGVGEVVGGRIAQGDTDARPIA
jgi:hypothetical protein